VGRSERGLRAEQARGSWVPMRVAVPHALLDVTATADGFVAVGHQGGLWASDHRGKLWHAAPTENSGSSFETLRAVAFDPTGRFGLAVGEKGRVVRSLNGGGSWQSMAPPAQEDPRALR